MTPADIRNANFDQLRDGLEAKLREVYQAFVVFGPGTTRAVAERSGIEILTLRPRAHDLHEVGLLECSGRVTGPTGKKEGVYEAVTPEEWARWHGRIFSTTGAQLQIGALTA